MNFNTLKNDKLKFIKNDIDIKKINFKYDVEIGCQLSKEILTNVISNRDLYAIKKMLIAHNLLGNVPLYTYIKYDDNGEVIKESISFYSKEKKKAISYFINPTYLNNYNEMLMLKNKYADKHVYLMKHSMLFGNKRKSVNTKYLPFNNDEMNRQYNYQKNMTIDPNDFHEKLIQQFPELIGINNIWYNLNKSKFDINNLDVLKTMPRYNEILSLYKTMISLNTHTFSAKETYGRIFMPLQYIPSEFRESIRFNNTEKLVELFDIKCCFVQLAGRVAISKETDIIKKEEYKQLIDLAKTDIYYKILLYINDGELTRDDIKHNMMGWLFSTDFQRTHNKNKIVIGITEYFKQYFPYFYDFVKNYELELSNHVLKNTKRKRISKLCLDCFYYESHLMFDYVLPYLHKEYNIPFMSLHDGIWTTDKSLESVGITRKDFYLKIETLIDMIEYK